MSGTGCIAKRLLRLAGSAGQPDAAASAKPFKVVTTDSKHSLPVAANVLEQEFDCPEPDRIWVGDITCIQTDEGVLHLAGIKDLCTRKIVGWSMDEHMPAELVMDALKMALGREHPAAGLIHHSARGPDAAGHDSIWCKKTTSGQ